MNRLRIALGNWLIRRGKAGWALYVLPTAPEEELMTTKHDALTAARDASLLVIYKAARKAVHGKRHDHGLFISEGYSYEFEDVEVRAALANLIRIAQLIGREDGLNSAREWYEGKPDAPSIRELWNDARVELDELTQYQEREQARIDGAADEGREQRRA